MGRDLNSAHYLSAHCVQSHYTTSINMPPFHPIFIIIIIQMQFAGSELVQQNQQYVSLYKKGKRMRMHCVQGTMRRCYCQVSTSIYPTISPVPVSSTHCSLLTGMPWDECKIQTVMNIALSPSGNTVVGVCRIALAKTCCWHFS